MTQDSATGPAAAEAPARGPGGDAVLTDQQNWAARTHRELYQAVHQGNDPSRTGRLAEEWNAIGRELAESAQQMSERLKTTESGWQGDAAGAARAAIRKLVDWNHAAGEVAGELGGHVERQGRVMETARAEMPEPVERPPQLAAETATTYAGGGLAAFHKASTDLRAHREQVDSAHQKAVEVMQRMETRSREIDGATPRFEAPPNPLQEQEARKRATTSPAGAKPEPAGTENPQPAGPGAAQQPAAVKSAWQQDPQQQAAPPMSPQAAQQHGAGQLGPAASVPQGAKSGGPGARGGKGSGPGTGGEGGDKQATKKIDRSELNSGGSAQKTTKLPHIKPSDTNSQSAQTQRMQVPDSAKQGPDGQHRPRSVPGPESTTGAGGQRLNPQQGPRSGSGGQRGGWNGEVPQIPGTGGGSGAGGAGGSGSSGDSGSPGPLGSPGSSGGSGGSVQEGGRAGVGKAGEAMRPGPAGGGAGAAGGSGGGSSSGAAGGAIGGAPPAGGQGRGGDEERTSKYVEGGPVVEVPGADLPPPVIGAGKPKKQPPEQQQDQG